MGGCGVGKEGRRRRAERETKQADVTGVGRPWGRRQNELGRWDATRCRGAAAAAASASSGLASLLIGVHNCTAGCRTQVGCRNNGSLRWLGRLRQSTAAPQRLLSSSATSHTPVGTSWLPCLGGGAGALLHPPAVSCSSFLQHDCSLSSHSAALLGGGAGALLLLPAVVGLVPATGLHAPLGRNPVLQLHIHAVLCTARCQKQQDVRRQVVEVMCRSVRQE